MGVVAVVKTLLIAVAERSGEIAVRSAIGCSRGRIPASLLLEGLAGTPVAPVEDLRHVG
jgi:ABC-type lipoprotein release transport system permease subunit